MRIPIRVRQFPAYVASCAYRAIMSVAGKPRAAVFKLCYFTCRTHFRYLYCSIHSLAMLPKADRFRVVIFCDREDFLEPYQIAAVQSLGLSVEVLPWGRITGWGDAHTASEWEGFQYASETEPACDFVAKVDSDVFFFSDWVFDVASRANADLFGDGHYDHFAFVQGGLYILKAKAVARILAKTPIAEFPRHFREANLQAEDRAAFYLAKAANQKVRLMFFMMSPTEYANAGRLTWYQRRKFSCLHYLGRDKAPMLDIYRKEMMLPRDCKAFNAVVDGAQ